MKRYLQFCLIFLISLALLLSGMAGVQAPIELCPMKAMGMAMMDGMGQDWWHAASLHHQASYHLIQRPRTILLPRFPSSTNPVRGVATAPHLIPVPH